MTDTAGVKREEKARGKHRGNGRGERDGEIQKGRRRERLGGDEYKDGV